MRVWIPALLLAMSCATSPAMRSPLKERLATADTPAVEDAARSCLTDEGWKVDPIGSVSGGSNVVSAKMKDQAPMQVWVHAPDQKPRVTGGPDDAKFWKCLADKLGGGRRRRGGRRRQGRQGQGQGQEGRQGRGWRRQGRGPGKDDKGPDVS